MPDGARAWQRVLLVLCSVGLFAVAESAWATYYLYGDAFGGSVYAPVTAAPFLDRFASVIPGSVADRSGIRSGDAIDLRLMTPAARYQERDEMLAGVPVRFPIVRDGALRFVTITPERYTQTAFWRTTQWWLAWMFWLGSAFSLCVAGLLIWRRPDSDEVRVLSLTLILIVLGESLFPINGWLTPWAALDAILNVVAQLVFSTGIALLAAYALQFGRPISLARRALTAITFVCAAVSALVWTGAAQGNPGPGGVLGIAGLWFGALDIHAWIASRPLPLIAATMGPPVLALLCALLAVRAADGAERTRVAWATGSLSILYLFGAATIQSYVTTNIVVYYYILNIAWFLAPVGLMYALLKRRLLDVGFVLNRAAVFTGISVFVVGVFSLIEWALGGWLNNAGRVANVAVSAAIVVALGFSLRTIHARVDRFVDSVFFRKRHEDEAALRRFAREVAFITDAQLVIRRGSAVLRDHADASAAQFALHDGHGRYGGIDENDPALVTLRASRDVVDLHLTESALAGEFVYPMLARGQLIGALVLGPKMSGEPYAPDESAAIAQLAHAVGVALDLIGTNAGRADDIAGALRSVEASNRAVSEALRGLPDAIAERMGDRRL